MENNKNKLTPEGSIVNFVFFLYNHSGIFNIIAEVFKEDGQSMVDHLCGKLKGYMDGDQICRPQHIIKWMTELEGSRKKAFAKYICENYDCGAPKLRELDETEEGD